MSELSDFLNSGEYREYLELLDKAKVEYEQQVNIFFNSLNYDDQLKVFYHVVKNIYEGSIIEQGSYRHIIYGKFNFGPDSYALGMDCGLLELNNSIYSHEEISKSLKDVLKYLNLQVDELTFTKLLSRFTYGTFGHKELNQNMQLSLNLDDN